MILICSAIYLLLLLFWPVLEKINSFILYCTGFQVQKKDLMFQVFLLRHGGFEPPTTWLKVRCSTDWASIPYHRKMPRTGIEPVTRGFSVLCSTNWAIWALSSGDRIWTYDLRVMSPTSFQTAPPRVTIWYCIQLLSKYTWKRMDGGGFEPPKQIAADLQSVPFGHSGIHPYSFFNE